MKNALTFSYVCAIKVFLDLAGRTQAGTGEREIHRRRPGYIEQGLGER